LQERIDVDFVVIIFKELSARSMGKACKHCSLKIDGRGLPNHEAACKKKGISVEDTSSYYTP